MRFSILLVFVALTVMAIMAKDLRADTSTAAPVTTPVTEGTGSTVTVSGGTEGTGSTASSQAPATTEGNGASTISSTSVLLLSVAMCLFKF